MDATNSLRVRAKARELLIAGWNARKTLWPGKDISLDDFLLHGSKVIATGLLGLKVVEIIEIPNPDILSGRRPSADIAGVLDRVGKQITIAQKFGYTQSRFTLAHEIAHWLLHPQMMMHREKPLNLAFKTPRSPIEQEADLFGAEFLMPSKLVREHFLERFKGIMDGKYDDGAMYFWLSQDSPQLNEDEFYADDPKFRAMQIAKTRLCYGRRIISLCEHFRVSPVAMAIQLIDLGLVK